MLGELRAIHGAYRADDLVVAATEDLGHALARALDRIAGHAASPAAHLDGAGPAARADSRPGSARAMPSQQPDGYLQARGDGTFTRVADGQAVPYPGARAPRPPSCGSCSACATA